MGREETAGVGVRGTYGATVAGLNDASGCWHERQAGRIATPCKSPTASCAPSASTDAISRRLLLPT